MKKQAYSILFLWILASQLVHASQTLVINTTGESPLNTPEQTGFLDLVAAEAFRRSGLKLETVMLPAERGLINVNLGIEDGEMSRIAGLEKIYPNLIRVPESIMDWEFYAFSELKINLNGGWPDLTNYSVAFINGWKILERNVPAETEITKVKNPEQLFYLLARKRTQVVIYERWAGLRQIQQTQLKKVRLIQPALSKREMYMYLHKKHRVLAIKIAEALVSMKRDGSYDKLEEQILEPLK